MRRLKQSTAILAIAIMVLMTACGKNNSTASAVTSTTVETTTEPSIETTTEAAVETTTEASMEVTTPEETTPEAETTEEPTTVKQTEAPTTVKQTEAPTTVKQTEAPTTVKQTEAPTTVKQTEAPTTVKQTEAPTTVKQTEAPTTVAPTEAPTQAPSQTLKKYDEYSVGDIITFGKYNNHNLEWIVLEKEDDGNILYLFCKNVIKESSIYTDDEIVYMQAVDQMFNFVDLSIAKWIDGEFKSAAFNAQQIKYISNLSLIHPMEYGNYFDGNGALAKYATAKNFAGKTVDYWTCYINDHYGYCCYVDTNGGCTSDLDADFKEVKGIRPYMSITIPN